MRNATGVVYNSETVVADRVKNIQLSLYTFYILLYRVFALHIEMEDFIELVFLHDL